MNAIIKRGSPVRINVFPFRGQTGLVVSIFADGELCVKMDKPLEPLVGDRRSGPLKNTMPFKPSEVEVVGDDKRSYTVEG